VQKITPFLWFNNEAEQAAQFYLSIFENGKITATTYYGEEGPGPSGSVMTVSFELNGEAFVALNGGPQFPFTEAVSFVVNCETQAEIDYFWEKLAADGGKYVEWGWLKDKFGLAWQIVPTKLWKLIEDGDRSRVQRVMHAVMQMTKLDLATLERAYEQR
jgi:predicted 3-demethylubiquinone-9 3-methyltransferase (glyoxalase superfamily)